MSPKELKNFVNIIFYIIGWVEIKSEREVTHIIIYFQFYYKIAAAALNTGALGLINDLYLNDNILVMVAILVAFSSNISL